MLIEERITLSNSAKWDQIDCKIRGKEILTVLNFYSMITN